VRTAPVLAAVPSRAGAVTVRGASTPIYKSHRELGMRAFTRLHVYTTTNRVYEITRLVYANMVRVKEKFSQSRYRALGPELIPVYRQSARR